MQYKVPVMSELVAEGKTPDVIFWVGCAGSFDQRAQRVTIAFTKILNQLKYQFCGFRN
jgi:heterodisulfide reductase subunit D